MAGKPKSGFDTVQQEKTGPVEWNDVPMLVRGRADRLFEKAIALTLEILEKKFELAQINQQIKIRLDDAIDDDTVKTVKYDEYGFSRAGGYMRRSLDSKWAVAMLLQKGVKKSEIEDHMKESQVKAHLKIKVPKEVREQFKVEGSDYEEEE